MAPPGSDWDTGNNPRTPAGVLWERDHPDGENKVLETLTTSTDTGDSWLGGQPGGRASPFGSMFLANVTAWYGNEQG